MNPFKLAMAAVCFAQAVTLLQAKEPVSNIKLIPLADRVRVEIAGQLFTEYIYADGATRPYCYPILATDGTPMTRNFPMKKVAGEDTDHPWHRSLWFEHSMINGVDFWNEGKGDVGRSPADKGHTVQDKFTAEGDTIHTHDNWVAPSGKIVCTDERTIRFSGTGDARTIDYAVTLHAPTDEPVLIGD
ncbi:MAG TPA: DUF6807 family protein, partial [Verrucomicrobiae bacterium]|nr:DUF6807 family protein [Verrucomicrobiae bacterium]